MVDILYPLIYCAVITVFTFIAQFFSKKLTIFLGILGLTGGLITSGYGLVLSIFYSPFPVSFSLDWLKTGTFFIPFVFRLDLASALFQGLIYFVGLMVGLFSVSSMKDERLAYWPSLLLFVCSMNFLVLSDHLLTLFIGWELVGFCSFLMISFWYSNPKTAKASAIVLWINRFGDVLLLGGILMLMYLVQFQDLSEINPSFLEKNYFSIQIAGLLIGFGALSKSAQLFYYYWLPKAMVGPTPASALIHAATMVTAGIWVCLKLVGTGNFTWLAELLPYVGAITALWVSNLALTTPDPKAVLAYSTIAQLGLMLVGVGVAPTGQVAFMHLLIHGVYKSGLFLSIARIHHSLDKTDVHYNKYNFTTYPKNLIYRLPITFISHTILTLALIGIPFFATFLSKEAILAWTVINNSIFIQVAFYTITILTAFYGLRTWLYIWQPFLLDKLTKTRTDKNGLQDGVLVVLSAMSFWFFWTDGNPLYSNWYWIFDINPNAFSFTSNPKITSLKLIPEVNHTFLATVSSVMIILGCILGYKFKSILLPNELKNNTLKINLTWIQIIITKLEKKFFLAVTLFFNKLIFFIKIIEFYLFYQPVILASELCSRKHIVNKYYSLAIFFQHTEKFVIEGLYNFTIQQLSNIRIFLVKGSRAQLQRYIGLSLILFVMLILLVLWVR